jgi:hypothetical protein
VNSVHGFGVEVDCPEGRQQIGLQNSVLITKQNLGVNEGALQLCHAVWYNVCRMTWCLPDAPVLPSVASVTCFLYANVM